MTKKIERSYIREILDATNEETISFAGGLPDANLFPMEDLKSLIKSFRKSFINAIFKITR